VSDLILVVAVAAVGVLSMVVLAAAAIRREVAGRMDRLADVVARGTADDHALRQGVTEARALLEEMRRRDEEDRASLRRLETAFLGAATRGRVGENVVWEALSVLPPDMVDVGFRVHGKVVEFALRLPDGRRLPVDCKWAGVAEMEALESADGSERRSLAQAVERLVAQRAREVSKYLDPSLTAPFAVAAVPDAAYGVLRKAHLDAFGARVLVVPFSGALPVLLALYALCRRLDGQAADVGVIVSELGDALDLIERALETRVEHAAKLAQNAAAEIRTQLGRARGALDRGRAGSTVQELLPPAERPEGRLESDNFDRTLLGG
jgi:DNA recombination protein RmuC